MSAVPAVTEVLARIIVGTRFADLPGGVVTAAEQVVLDAIANTLAGSQEPMALTVLDAVTTISGGGNGRLHTVVGHDRKLPLLSAVFVNSVFCHCMDFEMMWLPLTHPTSPTVPAFFALSETRRISGEDLILAIALSFEIQGRLRKAAVDGGLPHLYGMHPPGVVGVIGSAVGAAKLLGLGARPTAMAISMACSRASGLMVNTGSMTKATHSGNAARQGLECALLVAEGCTASTEGIEGHFGLNETLYEGRLALSQLVDDFGKPYRMVEPGLAVKRFPTQYPTHWSIEAALNIKRKWALDRDDIVAVEIVVGSNNESAVREWPKTGLEGRFCLAYVVACALLDGDVSMGTFRDERLMRPDLAAIRPKIRVTLDPSIDAMDFSAARSTVRVTTARRELLEETVIRPLGIWDNPLTQQERERKFERCAAEVRLETAARAELTDRLRNLRAESDVSQILRLLRPEA